jgi:D-glycero-beta-D-manno-heptose-7-phosphate kinase
MLTDLGSKALVTFMIQEFLFSSALRDKLLSQLELFKKSQILLIGDIGLDEYVMGEVKRISPEAPVPVLEVEEENTRLGLAANVAQNILSLGGKPLTISVVGKDSSGSNLCQLFREKDLDTSHLIQDPHRPTTRKTRMMSRHHHLLRVDYEIRQFISPSIQKELNEKIDSLMPLCDGVIIQDYGKGVITPETLKQTLSSAQHYKKRVYVDPHRTHPIEFYSGCHLIKPNYDEALALTGLDSNHLKQDPNRIQILGNLLKSRSQASEIVITQGREGMTIFNHKGDLVRVPTFAKDVFDVTGAGDTVIATLTLGCSLGMPLEEACVLANFAAGLVVAKVGCVPCEKEELMESIVQYTIKS